MPAERFSAANAAMLLIDHQVGTLSWCRNIPQELIKNNTRALARAAKALEMPLVLTSSMEEHAQGPLLPDLEAIAPEEYARRVQRFGIVNCWDDPAYKAAVLATGRPNLIMAGLTNDVCIVYPAMSAVHEGYNVQVVVDAGGSPTQIANGRCFKPVALLPSRSQREPATRVGEAMLIQVFHCPDGQEPAMGKHGLSSAGKQRYRCRACREGRGRTLRLEYTSAGQSPAVKPQSVDRALNARGIRETARVLQVSPTTGINAVKNRRLPCKRCSMACGPTSSPSPSRWRYGVQRRWRDSMGAAPRATRWGATCTAKPLRAGSGMPVSTPRARSWPRCADASRMTSA